MGSSPFSAHFIVGPTCSGKSAAAQLAAERAGSEILSADSMLVYKGMDIGTAKPSLRERALVRYWGIDLVEPSEPFSVAHYRDAALAAATNVASRGRRMLVVGGTGLYVKTLLDGLAKAPAADDSLREATGRVLKEGGVEALADWLKAVNKDFYESLSDKDNPRRLVRALEKTLGGAKRAWPTWRASAEMDPIVGLKYPTDQLFARIEERARSMFQKGLLDEVELLLKKGLETAPTARYAIGYAEAIACLRGICSLEEAAAKTALRTRQLAKRQMTWFNGQMNIEWLTCDKQMSIEQIVIEIESAWKRIGPVSIATQ